MGVVGLLLSRSTEILKVTDNAGKTSLHMAAASGHYDMVQVLIGQGADLTISDKVHTMGFQTSMLCYNTKSNEN
jgi:ankyrin repeat protein